MAKSELLRLVAHKLAVLLHRLWVAGEVYAPERPTLTNSRLTERLESSKRNSPNQATAPPHLIDTRSIGT